MQIKVLPNKLALLSNMLNMRVILFKQVCRLATLFRYKLPPHNRTIFMLPHKIYTA